MIMFNLTEHSPYPLDDVVGMIPSFLSEINPASTIEQLDTCYPHGGGWRPMREFVLHEDNSIQYPGDPPHKPWATAKFREDTICVYESAWVAVIHSDRTFEVSRMD